MRELVSNSRIEYINSLFGREDQIQKKVRDSLEASNKLGINVDAYEGQLLSLFVAMVRPKVIVEFGTLYGYSTLWMAQSLIADAQIYTLEKSEENAQMAQSHFNQSSFSKQIQLIVGDAKQGMQNLPEQVDLVFIDANKSAYLDYLHWAKSRLRPGGMIIGDNTFLFGTVAGEKSAIKVSQKQIDTMKAFNKELSEDDQFVSSMIPTPEGMTVAFKI